MKILHISSVPIDYPGGTEKVISELSARQAKKHSVSVLQTNLYMPTKKCGSEKVRGVNVLTCKNDFWLGGFGFSREFINKLQEIWMNFDIIHIHGHGRFTSTYALSFLKNKKPIIYSAQGFFHKQNVIKKVYDLLFGRLLKNADFCTALTNIEENHLTKKFGINREKIKILPGGVDIENFGNATKKDIIKFKKRFNLDKKTLLYVGRIHESKGLQPVIEAIENIDCKFLIIGKDAGYKPKLIEQLLKLKLSDKIIFAEELNDKEVATAYQSADTFVLFSDWEGFGIVVIEAMASGVPVVVSNNGALPTLVKDGINGYVAKNKYELKNKIKFALNCNKKLITNAKNFSTQFDWNKINRNLENIYEKAT